MRKFALPFVMISFISCTSETNKTCSCIREATNNAIIEGNELSEDDLIALCVESQEKLRQLPLKEKSAIAKCMDSAMTFIPTKTLFPEKEPRTLTPIKDSKEIESKIVAFKNRYNGDQAVLDRAGYYFSKRHMKSRLLVDRMDRNLTTEEAIINDDKIEVIGRFIEGNNINKIIQVRLKMPFQAMTDIKESYHPLVGDDEYNQMIDFEGICSQFASTVGGEYSLTFDVDNYKLINKKEVKATSSQPIRDTTKNISESNSVQFTQQTGTVLSDKAYFYREADLNTKRKGYLIRGQAVDIGERNGDFVFCSYNNGKTTGWMLRKEIQ